MSYVNDLLGQDERITYQASISGIRHISTLLTFMMMLATFMPMSLRKAGTELALTNKRLVGRSGGKTLRLNYKEIESVTVRRGMLGWAFDYGTIVVTGKDDTAMKFKNIKWPLVFQQEADEAIELAVLGRKLSDTGPSSF